ncbi:MAG: hypothetical protein K0S74_790 [Chlamydiales bacterium]|jgi:hypothetical protein|nr:hypothetical protein [Chlamydiales bacterium]
MLVNSVPYLNTKQKNVYKDTHTACQKQRELCGVCEKMGADVFWLSHISKGAHKTCFIAIAPLEQEALYKISMVYAQSTGKITYETINAHRCMVEAVREFTGDATLLEYLEAKGPQSLKVLFDTVGIGAVFKKISHL